MIKEFVKDHLTLSKKGDDYIIINSESESIALVKTVLQPGESFKATPEAVEAIMRSGGMPYRMKNAMLVQEGKYEYNKGKRFELPKEKLVIQIFD